MRRVLPSFQPRGEASSSGYVKTAGYLGVVYGLAGGLTYGFFAVCSHVLNPADYGEIVVLWTAAFITFSTIARPIEPFVSRSIAASEGNEQAKRHALLLAAGIQAALALGFVVVALLFKGPLEAGLFGGEGTLYWFFLATVVGFSIGFYVRGYLAGSRKFRTFAAMLFFEGGSRFACVLILLLGLSENRDVAAAAIALAPLGSLLPVIAVGVVGRTRTVSPAAASDLAVAPSVLSDRLRGVGKGSAFTAGVIVVMLSEQLLISTGPLLVRDEEGAALAGFVFNELMLLIAPLLLFQAVVTSLLPHLTRLRVRGAAGFEESLDLTLRATACFAMAVASVVILAGPALMQIAFGDNFEYPRSGLLLIALAMGFYLAATALNQALLAQGRAVQTALRWAVCGAFFVGWNLLAPLEPVRAVETGLLAASVLLFASLYKLQSGAQTSAGGLS